MALQPIERIGLADGASVSGDQTKLSLSSVGGEVGESNTSAPDFGHGARE